MAVALTAADSHLYCVGAQLPNTANAYTINVWLNATWSTGGVLSFVGLYNGTPGGAGVTTGAGLQIGSRGAGQLTCWTYGGDIKVQTTAGFMTAFDGRWVMVTYVSLGGNQHLAYVNGALAASNTSAFTATQMTQVYINGYPPSGNANETSSFQVEMYSTINRALTSDEILSLYNNEGSRGGPMAELACRYEFSELAAGNPVTQVVDVTGNNQNLLHIGGTNTTSYTYSSGVANSNMRPVL